MRLASACVAVLVPLTLAWGQARPAPPLADQAAAPNRAGWAVDARTGCWLWNAHPREGETVLWNGGCDSSGRATGPGVAEWHRAGKIDRTEGEYRDGKRNGRGVHISLDGLRYEGEFRDDKFHGRGVLTFVNGNRYEGEFGNNLFQGSGVLTFANGNRYDGEWRDGKPNGRGVYLRVDGNRFAGEWRDGCFREGRRNAAIGRPLSECR